jgi:hypothetical protein
MGQKGSAMPLLPIVDICWQNGGFQEEEFRSLLQAEDPCIGGKAD